MAENVQSAAISAGERSHPHGNRRTLVSAYYASFVALGLFSGVLGPTLPGLAAQTRTQLSGISLVLTAHGLGYILGTMLGGRFYYRVPGHRIMAGALIVMSLTMLLVPTLPLLWVLVPVVLVLGIAGGTLDVGGNTLLLWAYRAESATAMNGLHLFFGAGALLSPIVVAQVITTEGGYRWAYWLLAPLMWPAAAWLLRLRSPGAPPVDHTPTGRVDLRLVGLIALFQFFCGGAESGFASWIYTYGTTSGMVDKVMGAYLTSVFWGTFTLGRLMGVFASTRWTPRQILLVCVPGSLAGLCLMFGLPDSLPALWAGTALTGLLIGPVFASMMAFAGQATRVTGQVTGIIFLGASLGMMFVPWTIGQFIETVGPEIMIDAVASSLLLALGTLGLVMAKVRRLEKAGV